MREFGQGELDLELDNEPEIDRLEKIEGYVLFWLPILFVG